MDGDAFIVNVDGAVVRDGESLFVERAIDGDHTAGLLGRPGGKLEPGVEGTAAFGDTVGRELAEEAGVEVGHVEHVCSATFEADDGTPCLNVVTVCEYAGVRRRPGRPTWWRRSTG